MLSPLANPKEYISQSGCHYNVDQVIQEETSPFRRVYSATANNEKFILKYVHEDNLEDLQDLKGRLRGTNYVRLVKDTIPEESMFVFQYFTDHLLRLAQKDLPLALTKRILKDALRGIVELHDRDIVHTDIKADNILINWNEDQDGIGIERVQIADLEDAVYVPPGQNIVGLQAGNWMWRSPEAHVRGPINKPSDIFSFALVCIHAVHKRVIFAVGEEELVGNLNREATVVARQMSYFADREGLCAFLDHIGDNPWVPLLEAARDGAFKKDKPRRLFSLLGSVDEDFENLVYAMANFDPAKRITAREALAHKWFDGV